MPADKKLPADWLASLTARGEPKICRGEELKHIGMPVGGICAGTVYLGGDGKLWLWDVFNHIKLGVRGTQVDYHGTKLGPIQGEVYVSPMKQVSPVDQGFSLRYKVGDAANVRALDGSGWQSIEFRGAYPMGMVRYRDPQVPLQVDLEAYSPFIPLNTDDSSLPATVMRFTVTNTGDQPAEVEIAGWLENIVGVATTRSEEFKRSNTVERASDCVMVLTSGKAVVAAPSDRPDIVFADFEGDSYAGWTTEGTAFGPGPLPREKAPGYMGPLGGEGKGVITSHNVRNGEDVGAGDNHKGRLLSDEFTVSRNYIAFYIGGGKRPGETGIRLLVDGKQVRVAGGENRNEMSRRNWDVKEFMGKKARIEIFDQAAGGWGNVTADHIVFTDTPPVSGPVKDRADIGSMALSLLEPGEGATAFAALPATRTPELVFGTANEPAEQPDRPVGGVRKKLNLAPKQSATATFVVAWHLPNLRINGCNDTTGRYYGKKFTDAGAVMKYVAANFPRLHGETKAWVDTWYDSTLPFWLLDRAFLNTSILATTTCYRFGSGRFWAWEGVGCCAGTCTHVWSYAQAMGRLFPELERDLRARTDYGLGFDANSGVIRFRGEGAGLAVDGQAGCILRTYREHQMSADDSFLRPFWPKVKKSMECLMAKDNGTGLLDGAQHNTLDKDWYGPVAWLSGMYHTALRACEEMAKEMGDAEFAARCRERFEKGTKAIVAELYNGEYFVNRPDPKRPDEINSGTGCHIDQVYGQSWAWQVGLGRTLPREQTLSALRSLWKYNFAPDVGPFRAANKPGRWYVVPGEGGLLMCTFPRPDWNYAKAAGKGPDWAAGYFNECMTGFEYQAAWHMIAEGLVQEGLAVTRAIHDRYAPSKRNPYNEIECSDHYARAMASYGVFTALCGFEHHGPKGHLGFAPRLTPEDFKASFTAAEGWGTFAQKKEKDGLSATVALKWGTLRLKTLALQVLEGQANPTKATVLLAGKPVEAKLTVQDRRAVVEVPEMKLTAGQSLSVQVAS